jgi:hypothetical protein
MKKLNLYLSIILSIIWIVIILTLDNYPQVLNLSLPLSFIFLFKYLTTFEKTDTIVWGEDDLTISSSNSKK